MMMRMTNSKSHLIKLNMRLLDLDLLLMFPPCSITLVACFRGQSCRHPQSHLMAESEFGSTSIHDNAQRLDCSDGLSQKYTMLRIRMSSTRS